MSATIVHTPALVPSPARAVRRSLAIVIGALALACSGAQAQSHGGGHSGSGHSGGGHSGGGHSGGGHSGGGHDGGWHHGGYYGHYGYRGGWGWDPWWGIGLGVGIGLATAPVYYDEPSYVVVNPPAYYPPAPVYATPAPVYPAPAPAAADPIFYPRNGQSAAQTEGDRQECNRWATTQPRAMADASIFQRATLACMDGRGYTAH